MGDPEVRKEQRAAWRGHWHEIIFGHEARAERLFDLILLVLILLSVLTVLLESVPTIQKAYGTPLRTAEWIFTALCTIEYVARLATATDAKR